MRCSKGTLVVMVTVVTTYEEVEDVSRQRRLTDGIKETKSDKSSAFFYGRHSKTRQAEFMETC